MSQQLGVISADGDRSRWLMGLLCFAAGLVAFAWGACWAAGSLEDAIKAALTNDKPIKQEVALLFGAKAVLVVGVEGFAIALLRTGERLTMPLARYLQYVEKQGQSKVSESTASEAVDLVQKVLDVIKQGTELGKKS